MLLLAKEAWKNLGLIFSASSESAHILSSQYLGILIFHNQCPNFNLRDSMRVVIYLLYYSAKCRIRP